MGISSKALHALHLGSGFPPCVSGILPRPDLHNAGVDRPRNLKNRGETPLTQTCYGMHKFLFRSDLPFFPVRGYARVKLHELQVNDIDLKSDVLDMDTRDLSFSAPLRLSARDLA